MLTKTPAELDRSSRQTGVERRAAGLGAPPGPAGPDLRRVLVTCGDAMLPEEATEAEYAAFEAAVQAMSTDDVLAATADRANSPSAVEFLLGICQERWLTEGASGG